MSTSNAPPPSGPPPGPVRCRRVRGSMQCGCGEPFPNAASRDAHIAIAQRRYQCTHCGELFGRGRDLRRHEEEIVLGLRPHTCPWQTCNRHINGFSRPERLREHIRCWHTDQRLINGGYGADVPMAPTDGDVNTSTDAMQVANNLILSPSVVTATVASVRPMFDPLLNNYPDPFLPLNMAPNQSLPGHGSFTADPIEWQMQYIQEELAQLRWDLAQERERRRQAEDALRAMLQAGGLNGNSYRSK